MLSIKAVKGIVHTTVKNKQIKTYTIKNRNEQERLVLIEHPVNNDFRLTGDKPKETASDFYRFEVKVPPGKTKTQVVTEEQEVRRTPIRSATATTSSFAASCRCRPPARRSRTA